MQTDEKPHDWDRSAVYCTLGRKVNESMKKVIAPVLLLCLLTVTASAAYVPEEVVSENRDGRQLVVKTYVLSPEADPGELIEEPFELEGCTYHYFEVVNGKTEPLKITNQAVSGILIHKIDTSGEGIYGVKFILYDEEHNPIGEFTSDDEGYLTTVGVLPIVTPEVVSR